MLCCGAMLSVFVTISVLAIVLRIYTKITAGRCKSNVSLIGKTVLVTGGNSGIGYQTALALAGRGARVIIADKDNAEKSKKSIIKFTHNDKIVTKYVDFRNLDSVRKLAKDIIDTEDRLDILINNAGVGLLGNNYTDDDLHIGMQINHFAPFLLTHLLTGLLKKSAPSRIVFVSSILSFFHYLTEESLNKPQISELYLKGLRGYTNSKLCNILMSDEFARRLADTGVTSNSVHPGMINSQIFIKSVGIKYIMLLINAYNFVVGKTPEEGAQTTIYTAISEKLKNTSGEYLMDCKISRKPTKAHDLNFVKCIWNASVKYTKLSPDEMLC